MDLNKVMLIGRLTQDPEVRTTPNGTPVVNFGLATGRVWTDQAGQKQEKTEFSNIVAWRRLAEICGQYLRKGSKVYLEGRLETRSWEDQSGVRKYRTEVIADNMIMLDGRPAGSGPATPRVATAQPEQPTTVPEPPPASNDEIKVEDIPF